MPQAISRHELTARQKLLVFEEWSSPFLAVPLNRDESLAITGNASIAVSKGLVEVWGSELKAQAFPFDFHQVIVAEAGPFPPAIARNSALQRSDDDKRCDICNGFCHGMASLCHAQAGFDCVLLIKQHDTAWFSVDRLVGEIPRDNYWKEAVAWSPLSRRMVLQQGTQPGSSFMIGGCTGVGKSTLLQWCANKFLSNESDSVAILDLDPGQPLFGISACLSLWLVTRPILSFVIPALSRARHAECLNDGPSGEHIILVKSVYFGAISPENNRRRYLHIASHLYDIFCRLKTSPSFGGDQDPRIERFQCPPLLVNCCGWCAGTGWQLMDAIGSITGCKLLTMVVPVAGATETQEEPLSCMKDLQNNVLAHNSHPFEETLSGLKIGGWLPWFASPQNGADVLEVASVVTSTPPDTPAWGGLRRSLRDSRVLTHFRPELALVAATLTSKKATRLPIIDTTLACLTQGALQPLHLNVKDLIFDVGTHLSSKDSSTLTEVLEVLNNRIVALELVTLTPGVDVTDSFPFFLSLGLLLKCDIAAGTVELQIPPGVNKKLYTGLVKISLTPFDFAEFLSYYRSCSWTRPLKCEDLCQMKCHPGIRATPVGRHQVVAKSCHRKGVFTRFNLLTEKANPAKKSTALFARHLRRRNRMRNSRTCV